MKNRDYTKTPSYYNSEKVFKQYLGQTSYYLTLQNNLSKIIRLINPKSILELGSGTGSTSIKIAALNRTTHITAIDMREEMIVLGKDIAERHGLDNIKFQMAEMCAYVREANMLPEFTYFLYSFHHITDPIENKIDFLKDCYEKMALDSYLCIAEAFLPENTSLIDLKTQLLSLWSKRSIEGYASTFWSSIEGVTKEEIDRAKKIGNYSYDYEWKAGELVIERDNEYLVTVNELLQIATQIGYKIIISEPCNVVNDYIILLQK